MPELEFKMGKLVISDVVNKNDLGSIELDYVTFIYLHLEGRVTRLN